MNKSRARIFTLALIGVAASASVAPIATQAFSGSAVVRYHHALHSGVTGTVSAPTASGFSITERDGTMLTVATTTSTIFTTDPLLPAQTSVLAGEHVVIQLVAGATTPTAARVFIHFVKAEGTVQSIGSGTFTVVNGEGKSTVVSTTATTLITDAGIAATSVTVGEKVAVYGVAASTTTSTTTPGFNALFVLVGGTSTGDGDVDNAAVADTQTTAAPVQTNAAPVQTTAAPVPTTAGSITTPSAVSSSSVDGRVVSLSGGGFVISTENGGTVAVSTTSATVFLMKASDGQAWVGTTSSASPSLASVMVGEDVSVVGQLTGSNLSATAVKIDDSGVVAAIPQSPSNAGDVTNGGDRQSTNAGSDQGNGQGQGNQGSGQGGGGNGR